MKKVILTLVVFTAFALNMTNAQIKAPAASPGCKITQTVGLTEITLDYSRPSAKGRTIFGGLVPYGEMWRTGANKNSIITFSEPVKIAGKELKKGSYAIFTVPNPTEWEIIFYTDTENWGTPEKYDAAKEAVRFKAKAEPIPYTLETFSFDIGDLTNTSCSLGLGWDKTWVSFKMDLNTDDKVSANIKQVMGGPTAGDYYAAGRYYFEAEKDMKQAYDWVHKSNEMDPQFWKLRQEALILAKMGKYTEAIAIAEKSKEMAIKEGNKDYERMNTESIAEWTKMAKGGKTGGK